MKTLAAAALAVLWMAAFGELAAVAPIERKALAEAGSAEVLARGEVQLSPAAFPEGVRLVVREEKGLATLLGSEDNAKAVAQAAAAFGVRTIDFEKEMIVAVSAGPVRERLLKLDVSRLSVVDGSMQVEWAITRMMGRAADPLRHPVRLVLVKRFPGEVVFLSPIESLR
jgi:hypothetical protein